MEEPNVTADEMVQELLNINAQLNMQIAAQQVLIRKLRENQAKSNGQVEPVPVEN